MQSYEQLAHWQSVTPGPMVGGRRSETGGLRLHWLSGNGFCGGVYWPMLRELLPDYRLFIQDIESHGGNEPQARFSGTTQVRQRIGAVIREQGLTKEPLIGIGHSYGGAQTLRLAVENPGMFKALILLDPILMPLPLFAVWRTMGKFHIQGFANATRKRRAVWTNRDEVIAKLRGRGIYKGWTEEALASFADHATRDTPQGRALCCPTEVEAQIFEQPVYPWPAVRKIDIPVLFVRGAQSYEFFPWTERVIARLNPRIERRQLPGGHCFMQEDPQAAAALIKDFLRPFS